MAEETTETATTTAASEPGTPPAGEPKKFTQEDVDRIVGERLKRAEKRQPAAAATPVVDDASSDRVSKKQLQSELDDLRTQMAFNEAASEHAIPKAARKDMLDLYRAQKPTDDAEWFASKVASFGLKGNAVTQPNTPVPKDTATPPAAAADRAPSKVDPLTSGGLVDIWNLSPAQIDQLGPSVLREHFEKALNVGNQRMGAPPKPRIPKRQ
jgi:hypothetical protein